MSRNQDPFQIPRAGWEAAPSAGLASIDINANGGAINGGEFVLESSLGGVVIYAGYQALLTALRTEPALREDFLKEMRRFLPATTVRTTLENPDWWIYLVQLVGDQSGIAQAQF